MVVAVVGGPIAAATAGRVAEGAQADPGGRIEQLAQGEEPSETRLGRGVGRIGESLERVGLGLHVLVQRTVRTIGAQGVLGGGVLAGFLDGLASVQREEGLLSFLDGGGR